VDVGFVLTAVGTGLGVVAVLYAVAERHEIKGLRNRVDNLSSHVDEEFEERLKHPQVVIDQGHTPTAGSPGLADLTVTSLKGKTAISAAIDKESDEHGCLAPSRLLTIAMEMSGEGADDLIATLRAMSADGSVIWDGRATSLVCRRLHKDHERDRRE
jgi:hypothetical protein